ncbi:acyltransferase [Desertivirga brevis]|uniref:acyltransferase n=1 Tax=Desertivirga brevis TaxID=2810310 RepID=UPI001A9735FF|nr:acyltransferase [Pedobacter sp. SYSU D00873]
MKAKLKTFFISVRNRWGVTNSIKKSKESSVEILGNILYTSIRIKGNSKVVIGKGCRLRNASIKVRGNNNRVELEEGVFFTGNIELFGDGNSIKIGNNTRINGADFIVHNGTNVEVGARCLFSTKIDVRTTDSHGIYNADGERINLDKNIYIGEHVWIGRMVSILKGARIGNGSVIGSMSLVSGTIPNEVIAAGVPAKPIKNNISWKE